MNMQKSIKLIFISFISGLLASCATVKDIQRSTDLIRTDNELTRLLVEVRPSDQAGASTYLEGLAAYAKGEADKLKSDSNTYPEAIAFYRISATAYWRSGKPEIVNELFEVTDSGMKLCADMGKNAPDRDCMFMQLVIPFAGLESKAKNPDISVLLESINFTDNNKTSDEIDTMKEIQKSLIQVKPLIQKIMSVGTDNRLMSHQSMSKYYCENAKKAFKYFDNKTGLFITKIKDYKVHISDNISPLGITIDEGRKLQKLEIGLPSFCQ
jgi:hypothetical protein